MRADKRTRVEKSPLPSAGEGVSNILKYAFNMNLAGPDTHAMPVDEPCDPSITPRCFSHVEVTLP